MRRLIGIVNFLCYTRIVYIENVYSLFSMYGSIQMYYERWRLMVKYRLNLDLVWNYISFMNITPQQKKRASKAYRYIFILHIIT